MKQQYLTRKEIEYICILYEYRENGFNRITTSELASKTYVTLGSVTSFLKKLSSKQMEGYFLINYMKGFGVALTPKGLEIAGKVIRRRRIGEIFLTHLKYDFYTIQDQLYQFSITEEIANTLEEEYFKFENEKRCSHGYIVPDKNGLYQFEHLQPISQFTMDSKIKIIKIPESPFYYIPKYSPSETKYFVKIYNYNLFPDQIVRIISKDRKFIIVEIETNRVNLPIKGFADQIYCIREDK